MTKLIIALILSLLMNLVFGITILKTMERDSLRVAELGQLQQTHGLLIEKANYRAFVERLECNEFINQLKESRTRTIQKNQSSKSGVIDMSDGFQTN